MRKLRPLRDRVCIQRDTPSEMSEGGIILPEIVKDPPTTGVVVAVGPGKVNHRGVKVPMEVKLGDRVLLRSRWVGNNVIVDGHTTLIVPEEEILARLVQSEQTSPA